jgi:ornithine--oxo-acid transaminase
MIGDTEVKLFTEAFGEVLEDASKGSGLIWEFGRTLVKQAVRNLAVPPRPLGPGGTSP